MKVKLSYEWAGDVGGKVWASVQSHQKVEDILVSLLPVNLVIDNSTRF
ncbi:MAG: hypothetical protein V9G21_09905 [Methylotenera sp.]